MEFYPNRNQLAQREGGGQGSRESQQWTEGHHRFFFEDLIFTKHFTLVLNYMSEPVGGVV